MKGQPSPGQSGAEILSLTPRLFLPSLFSQSWSSEWSSQRVPNLLPFPSWQIPSSGGNRLALPRTATALSRSSSHPAMLGVTGSLRACHSLANKKAPSGPTDLLSPPPNSTYSPPLEKAKSHETEQAPSYPQFSKALHPEAWPATADQGTKGRLQRRAGCGRLKSPTTQVPSSPHNPWLHSLSLVPYRGRISSWSLSSAGIADICKRGRGTGCGRLSKLEEQPQRTQKDGRRPPRAQLPAPGRQPP